MESNIYNCIYLSGDKYQIEHFKAQHTYTKNNTVYWDCYNFLSNKDLDNKFLKNSPKCGIFDTEYDFIFITTKNEDLSQCLIVLSKYYTKITIKLEFFDENYNKYYGWLFIENGKVLGFDHINLDDIYYPTIENKLTILGNKDDILDFLIKNNISNKTKFIRFKKNQIPDIGNNLILQNYNDYSLLTFKTYKKPCSVWLMKKSPLYPKLNFCLNFKDTDHKFMGSYICSKDKIKDSKFIVLEKNDNKNSNLFKYNNYDEYYNHKFT